MSLSEKVGLSAARRILGQDIIIWENVDFKNKPVFLWPEKIERMGGSYVEKGMGKMEILYVLVRV